jgi:hypothetical protein
MDEISAGRCVGYSFRAIDSNLVTLYDILCARTVNFVFATKCLTYCRALCHDIYMVSDFSVVHLIHNITIITVSPVK